MNPVKSIQEIIDSGHNYWIANQDKTLERTNLVTFYIEKFKGLLSCFFLQDRTSQPLLEKALRNLIKQQSYTSDLLNRTELTAARLGIKKFNKRKIKKIIASKISAGKPGNQQLPTLAVNENKISTLKIINSEMPVFESNTPAQAKEGVEAEASIAESAKKLSFEISANTKIAAYSLIILAGGLYLTNRLLSLSDVGCMKDWTRDSEGLIYEGCLDITEASPILDFCIEKVAECNKLPLYTRIGQLFGLTSLGNDPCFSSLEAYTAYRKCV